MTPELKNTRQAAPFEQPVAFRYITNTDRSYIAHDLPRSLVLDIFASGSDRSTESKVGWEGIAIGILVASYALLGSAVIFKVAAFGSLFVG